MANTAVRLSQVKARIGGAREGCLTDQRRLASLDAPRLVDAVESVIERHKIVLDEGIDVCEHCSTIAGPGVVVTAPCLTVRLIETALGYAP